MLALSTSASTFLPGFQNHADFCVNTPEIQIECKMRRCDRVELTTCVNVFMCQLDAQNKI